MILKLILILIIVTLSSNAQTLKKGDNLQTELNKVNKPYYFNAPKIIGWAEAADMLLICDKTNPNDCDFVFLALKDTTLIGILKIKPPKVFMIDTDGDSLLDIVSEYFLLPFWTVKRNTKVDSSDKTILSILDKMYEKTLQSDEIDLDEGTVKEYQQFQNDTSLANRHIALIFDTYQKLITESVSLGKKPPPDICIYLMQKLADECVSLYDHIPVIICIYMGESLESADLFDRAREHFKMSLEFYPNSIPLLVYNYRLEQDPIKKNEQLKDLKIKYSKHWMVKDL